jgi:diguanylate cyclase (GGDEF)-like protein
MGIRGKLIALFVIIKVLPLMVLGWVAWEEAKNLGRTLALRTADLVKTADQAVSEVGKMAIADSVAALDLRARDDIERLTTDLARQVASFLYDRDEDIRSAAKLEPNEASYRRFLESHFRVNIDHGPWQLAPDGKSWRSGIQPISSDDQVDFGVKDNAREFHYRKPERFAATRRKPLYFEMSFVDLVGNEVVKITTSNMVSAGLRNIADRRNTFIKAETYFGELKKLEPGEIYVSDVIGAYVGSKVIGNYTPEAAAKAGIPYDPEKSAYAGKENPVGQRFQGLVRWATPVVKNGRITGYVTLALDHEHIAEFTDHVTLTEERYSDITDAASGNYAFMWDAKGRSIVHPRHYFIVGYDPETGEQVEPWLEKSDYAAWKASGLPYAKFIESVPPYRDQGLNKKPAVEMIKQGKIALDCRYLNFAPQCVGWHNMTQHGGSGSFVILWSDIWKLTTAATIPYFTGPYSKSPRGFGYVTIGANIDEFHRPANESKERLDTLVAVADREMSDHGDKSQESIRLGLTSTAQKLVISTMIMVAAVIGIAIWLASSITSRITFLIAGIGRFEAGERQFRFIPAVKDEMGRIQLSFDMMADAIADNLHKLEEEIEVRRKTEDELRSIQENLEKMVGDRTSALTAVNENLRREVTERVEAETRANFLAGHDPLTGLTNRSLFNERLKSAIALAIRHNVPMALLFFDLDRFKPINDSLGHAVGDVLLKEVANILTANVRASDTVSRLGGDEFAVILTQIDGADGAVAVASHIIKLLGQPFIIDGREVVTGTSVGITMVPGDTDNPDQLLLHADLAMYQAKGDGGGHFRFFAPELHSLVVEKKQLESDIRDGIRREEFTLQYQPRYDLRTNKIEGAEALVRWLHPSQGLLLPGIFIDIAEKSGLLVKIDDQVLYAACRQAKLWSEMGIFKGRMAVNVSARQISDDDFVEKVLAALADTGLPTDMLEIELTEGAIMRNLDKAIAALTRLREVGIHTAIDDFGTDYSSLQRLIECPIDVIKIDRFFVSRIGNPKNDAVIAAILAMAIPIGATVVAEGVETEEQLAFLKRHNCHIIQGFLFSPAVEAMEFSALLRA